MKIYKNHRYDLLREISFPNKNELLAEFFGILTGDGFMNQYKRPDRTISVIEISGNRIKDYDYMENFVAPLIKRLFNLRPLFYSRESQNTIRIIINSKGVVLFLKHLDFPLGNKGQITPPKWIIKNPKFFSVFIRGVFDTDGSLSLKNKEGKKYPVVGLSSNSKVLLETIKEFLESCGISCYFGSYVKISKCNEQKFNYKLQISGKKNISLFFNKIGSNNPRNRIKYKEMCELYSFQQT